MGLSVTSMALTPLDHTLGSPTYSWNVLMFIITRLAVVNMFPGPSWWTSSLAPWTVSGLDPTVLSSDPTTSSSGRVVLVTTGLRDTTLKVLSWWTVFWMLSGRRPSPRTAC